MPVGTIHTSTTRSVGDSARLDRALAALKFTARNAEHPWLRRLALMKHWEAAARQKLVSGGYRVRFDRTDPRDRVF